jgi:GGDEF domain-containing protein
MISPPRLDWKILQVILLGFLAFLLAIALFTIYSNSFRAAPIFVFLLFLGIGSTLLLGPLRGGAVALVLVAGWITVKQTIGVWIAPHAFKNLVELVGLIILFALSGWYGSMLKNLVEAYQQNQQKLEQFNLEDKRIGLIKQSIGQLRLQEEEERSMRYKRPFSLILIMIQPTENVVWGSDEEILLLRSAANTVKISSRRTDMPFLAGPSMIGLLLPETTIEGASRVVHSLTQNMLDAKYLDIHHGTIRLQERLQIRYGFAAFLGQNDTPIDMFSAAQSSLQKNMEMNAEPVYQNVFLEWEKVGTQPVPSSLVAEKAIPS